MLVLLPTGPLCKVYCCSNILNEEAEPGEETGPHTEQMEKLPSDLEIAFPRVYALAHHSQVSDSHSEVSVLSSDQLLGVIKGSQSDSNT